MKYYQFSRSARQNYNEFCKNSGSSVTSYPYLENKVLSKSNVISNNTNPNYYYSDTSFYTENTNICYSYKQSKRNLHKEESLDLVPSKIDDADNYKIRQELQSKDFVQDYYESDTDNKQTRQKDRSRYSNKNKNIKSRKLSETCTTETLATDENFKHVNKMKKQFYNACKPQKNKIPLMVLKNDNKRNTDNSDIVYIPIVFMPDVKNGQNDNVPINLYEESSPLKTKRDCSKELLSPKEEYRSMQLCNLMKEQVQKQTQTTHSVAGLNSQDTVKEPEVVTVYEKSYADFNMQTENENSSKDISLKSEKPSLDMQQTEPSIDTIKNQDDSTPNQLSSETNEFINSENTFIFPAPNENRPTIKQPFTMMNTRTIKSKSKHQKTSGEKIILHKQTNDIYKNAKASHFTVEKMQSNCESVFSHICSKWKTKTYDIMNTTHNGKSNREIKSYYFETVNLQQDLKQFNPKIYENSFQSDIKQCKPKVLLETVPEHCGKLIQNVINNNKTMVDSIKSQENDLNKNLLSTKTKELKQKFSREKFINNKFITLKESIECDNKEGKQKKDAINHPTRGKLKPSIKLENETDICINREKSKTKEVTSADTNFQNELDEVIESILKGCHAILGKTIHNMVLDGVDTYAVFKEILFKELGIFKFKM